VVQIAIVPHAVAVAVDLGRVGHRRTVVAQRAEGVRVAHARAGPAHRGGRAGLAGRSTPDAGAVLLARVVYLGTVVGAERRRRDAVAVHVVEALLPRLAVAVAVAQRVDVVDGQVLI